MWTPLPDKLKVGDQIGCPKHYDPPEMLEVFKVDDDRVYCMRENGNAVTDPLTVDLLRSYDYQLYTKEPAI